MAVDRDDTRLAEGHRGIDRGKKTPTINQVIRMRSHEELEEVAVALRLRQILLELARRDDDIAHAEAVAVPYWASQPTSVSGHRAAALSLRFAADQFLRAP